MQAQHGSKTQQQQQGGPTASLQQSAQRPSRRQVSPGVGTWGLQVLQRRHRGPGQQGLRVCCASGRHAHHLLLLLHLAVVCQGVVASVVVQGRVGGRGQVVSAGLTSLKLH
jgi:hypothetical protein